MTLPAGGALRELDRGWPTLFGATLALAFSASALPFYTSGLFIAGFEKEFGWDRTAWSMVSTSCTLILALIAPAVGALADRFGVIWPGAVSFAALAAAFFLMSRISGDFAQYVLLQIAMVVLTSAATTITFTRPITATFTRLRGLALGVAIGGIGAAAYLAPPLVGAVIAEHGWRVAFERMSLAVLIAAPIAILFLSLRAREAPISVKARGRAVRLPLHDRLFWQLIMIFFLIALAVAGFVQHFVPMLTDRGYSLPEAAGIQASLGLAVLFGRLATGAAMDRVFAPRLAAVLVAITAAGMALLAAGGSAFAVPAAIGVGFAMGAEVDIIAYLTARYFDMAAYSRLYGVLYGSFLVGTAFSPLLIAQVRALTRGYEAPLCMSAVLLGVAAMLLLSLRRFPEPVDDATKATPDA